MTWCKNNKIPIFPHTTFYFSICVDAQTNDIVIIYENKLHGAETVVDCVCMFASNTHTIKNRDQFPLEEAKASKLAEISWLSYSCIKVTGTGPQSGETLWSMKCLSGLEQRNALTQIPQTIVFLLLLCSTYPLLQRVHFSVIFVCDPWHDEEMDIFQESGLCRYYKCSLYCNNDNLSDICNRLILSLLYRSKYSHFAYNMMMLNIISYCTCKLLHFLIDLNIFVEYIFLSFSKWLAILVFHTQWHSRLNCISSAVPSNVIRWHRNLSALWRGCIS